MKTITTRFWTTFNLMVICFTVAIQSAKAQDENPLVHVSFLDTIVADESTPFVRNNLNVTNIYNRPLTFTIHIKSPEGFSLISQNSVSLQLSPGETFIVPLTLNKLKSARAIVQQVEIEFDFLNPPQKILYTFAVSAKELYALRVFPIQKEFQLSPEQRTVDIKMKIKNIGNAPYEFFVRYSNKSLALDKKFYTTLNPFTDTLIQLKLVLPASLVKHMDKEIVSATVGTDTNSVTYSFQIRKIKNSNADHASPYASFPLTLEVGALIDNVSPSYFWGVAGAIDINENNLLTFNYRSKQYGMEGLQADVFNVFYRHKKWDITVGQMSAFNHFMANGIGAQISYRKNNYEGISASVVSNNLSFTQKGLTGQTAGINSKFKIGGMMWNAIAMGYLDPNGLNQSYIYQNKLDLIDHKNLGLALTLGAGLEQRGIEIPDLPTQLWGYNGGLDFRFERPKWRFESNAIVYTNDFPGIYKGWRSANADLSYFLGQQFSTSLFYTTNYTRQSFFIDSFYLDDQFLYNLTTYGLRINYHSSKFKLSLSGGNSHASGIQQTDVIPTYRMGIVNMTWTPIKKLRINLNSMVNFNEGYGIDNELVLHYSNFLSVSTPFGGINMAYKQMPQLTGDLSGTFVNSYRTSMGISPYLSTSLFRNKLSARIQYSYYKIKDVNTERDNQYLVGSMMYTNKRLGVSFQGNVNYGLPSANLYPIRFISASLRKTLNVPIITKRKYYDLNLYCFEDLDGNGVKDAGDSIVSKVNIDMNFNRLVSNKFGHARYKNMDTGTYVLDFRNMKNEKGLIPSRGYIQKLPFYGPVDLYIPFTQGKIVRGKVSITLDSLSANKFEIDQLKVTATDTEGNKYYTFTDRSGNYQINLPASNYVVSLNPEAFNDVFKPVQMAYNVDLLLNKELNVNFHIKQKARGINIIKADID